MQRPGKQRKHRVELQQFAQAERGDRVRESLLEGRGGRHITHMHPAIEDPIEGVAAFSVFLSVFAR